MEGGRHGASPSFFVVFACVFLLRESRSAPGLPDPTRAKEVGLSGSLLIAAGIAGPSGSLWMQPLLLLAFFGIMYFILIRPAHKRQKALQSMQESLVSGARVITSGGLKGTVVRVAKDSVKLRIAEKEQVDVTRSSIVGREDGEALSG